ncbi:hypothetical protein [Haladaptatus sp. DYF46]|uniref:hypothetical protein n=1 Tax=Haladaptatus sp. DYF46 TaxID=2886041 RepID=UPI001E48E03B|nr:hypothetical protein [Haladaptatus sp. DYF46]
MIDVVLAPLLVKGVVRAALDIVGAAGVPVALVVTLVSVAYYSRHALHAGAFMASWIRMGSVFAVLIAVLLASNVVDINLDAAFGLVEGITRFLDAGSL